MWGSVAADRRWLRLGVVGVTLVVALAATPAAEAMTRQRADALALRLLAPRHRHSPTGIIVYGLHSAVASGKTVGAFNGPERASSHALSGRTWLFWEDDAPGAFFAHPSRMLLLTDRGGHGSISNLQWWPLIDQRTVPFLEPDGSVPRRYVVYSSPGAYSGRSSDSVASPPPQEFGPAVAAPDNPPLQVGARDFTHDCLVTVGYETAPTGVFGAPETVAPDFEAMRAIAHQIGLRTIDGGDTTASMDEAVSSAIARGCSDVFLFLAGHGNASPQPAGVATRYGPGYRGGSIATAYVTPRDLNALFRAHNYTKPLAQRATFKVKIMSCHSGRFEDVLSRASNVQFFELSSRGDELAYGYMKDGARRRGHVIPNTEPHPFGASEFTNRDYNGLEIWAHSKAAAQDPDLATGLRDSFFEGAPYDFAATLRITHPIADYTPGAVSVTFPPEISAIHASFRAAPAGQKCQPPYCTTTYLVFGKGSDLHYTWRVSIPKDPECAKGFMPNKPVSQEATWYHADVSEGGYCNHTVYSANGYGHPGLVTVTVSNSSWSCVATFYGTQGPQGQPTYVGPAPQPCKHR